MDDLMTGRFEELEASSGRPLPTVSFRGSLHSNLTVAVHVNLPLGQLQSVVCTAASRPPTEQGDR